MSTFTTRDGTQIYYNDWGVGQPLVFSHGWPLTADAFEDQMFFLAQCGYRVIAHDRRGQPLQGNDMDSYADDLAELVAHLDLAEATHIGHSTGGGEVTRNIGRHGTCRQGRTDRRRAASDAQDRRQSGRFTHRSLRWHPRRCEDRSRPVLYGLSLPFYGYNRPGARLSQGVRDNFWRQGMMAGMPASHYCIKAFSETDLTEDLKRFDVPTLILHGEDDQIVPIVASGKLSSQIVKDSQLIVYVGGDHGICTTQKERVNADLLAFIADPAAGRAK